MSDRRVTYTPTPSPTSHLSLSCVFRFLGFSISTSKRFTTSSVESMYRNSIHDDQPSVWGSLTSSSFISLSFITPTPSHFISLTLTFSVVTNKIRYEQKQNIKPFRSLLSVCRSNVKKKVIDARNLKDWNQVYLWQPRYPLQDHTLPVRYMLI